ncbi:PfkB family carbohydrate kinase [Fibrobacterota bacterium]
MSKKCEERVKAAESLIEHKEKLRSKKIVIGFDGFIDEIIHVVDTKQNKDTFTRIETIKDFGKRIISASGKSSNIELVPIIKKLGGNGPIMSLATAGLGPHITCIGLLGYPAISEVFKPLAERCQVISMGEHGKTDALEFSDGKLMFGKLNTISEMCWTRIKKIMGEKAFARLITSADMVACTNWTMLTELEEIIENIIRIVPGKNGLRFFFDLADPEKRCRQEVNRLIEQMKRLNKKTPCILGLNLREAEQVSDVLGNSDKPKDGIKGLKKAATQIRKKLKIHGVAIHSVAFAAASVGDEEESIKGPFCAHPRITTGAGDHFNGGFCCGILAGLSLRDALYIGVGASGWYVRHSGRSPEFDDVIGMLMRWSDGRLEK